MLHEEPRGHRFPIARGREAAGEFTEGELTMLSGSVCYPTLPSKDIEAAKTYWTSKLGFSVLDTLEDGGVLLEAGDGSWLCLYPSSFAGTNKATACAFQVSDLEAAVSALQGKGVKFEEYDFPGLKTENGIATMGENKAAWFTDIDGNIIGVFQPAKVLARA